MHDVHLMMKDGSFRSFLQMWSDRYPYISKLELVREYIQRHHCTLGEAVREVTPAKKVDVNMRIGQDYILRKTYDKLSLLARIHGIWVPIREEISLDELARGNDLFPVLKVEVQSVCQREELQEAARRGKLEGLARRICRKAWKNDISLFCGEEIWRKSSIFHINGRVEPLHISTPTGSHVIPFTRKGVLAHLEGTSARLLSRGSL